MGETGTVARPFNPLVVIAVCFSIAVLEGYDIQAVGVAAPSMAPALGLNPGQIGWAGGISMIGLIFGALAGGWIADRWGRKPVLVVSVAWFGVFSIATAMAGSAEALLATRLLTGLGFGGVIPNIVAVAVETSPASRRTGAASAMAAGMPAGGALASLASGFLLHGSDWRVIFAIGGALPLLIAPIAFFALPETLKRSTAGPNHFLAALFGGRKALNTLLLWPLAALTQLVLFLMLGWLPLLVVAKGLGKADGASAALAFNVAGAIGAVLVGGWIDRQGTRWPMLATYAVMFVAMFALSGAVVTWQVVSLAGVVGFAVVGANLCLYGLAPHYYAAADRATGAGATIAAGRVGSVVGPLMAGALRANHAGAGEVLAWTLPVIAVAAVALLTLTVVGRPAES